MGSSKCNLIRQINPDVYFAGAQCAPVLFAALRSFFALLLCMTGIINPKIFTDITIPDTKFYSPHTGKLSGF
jgi:hypothetical protein